MYLLEEMTWQEAEKAFKEQRLAIVPTGSTEQHGPHMPLGTDFFIAETLAKEVGERVKAIVTPTLPIGYAEYHTDFPGTLSLSEETLIRVYKEICQNLINYGVTHIVFINGHGGNLAPLSTVSNFLRNHGVLAAIISWWNISGALNPEWSLIGHGDFIETSLVIAINEKLVKLDRAKLPSHKDLSVKLKLEDPHHCRFKGGVIQLALRTRDYTDTGDMIEYGINPEADHNIPPTKASPSLGKAILEGLANYIAEFIEEFRQVRLSPLLKSK